MSIVYEVFNGNNPIAVGTAKELAEKFGSVESSIRDAFYKNRKFQGMYSIRLKDNSKLSKKQKEIIELKLSLGKSVDDIYNETGIERRDITKYIESRNQNESNDDLEERVEKIVNKLLNERLKDTDKIEPLMSLKALGYNEFQLKDAYNNSIKKIKFSSDAVHIKRVDGKKQWSMPYTIQYKEIEAIYDEIVKKRGY